MHYFDGWSLDQDIGTSKVMSKYLYIVHSIKQRLSANTEYIIATV